MTYVTPDPGKYSDSKHSQKITNRLRGRHVMSVHNDNTNLNSISSDQRHVRHTINFLSKKLVKWPLKKV